jgi:hypothetical protein
MKLEQILAYVINALFFFFGDKIKGFRTIIINTITVLIGAWEFLTGGNGLFEFLCRIAQNVPVLSWICGLAEGAFYAVGLVVIGALNNILRLLTANAIGEATKPADLVINLDYASKGTLVARGVVAATAIGALAVILSVFFM